jgi:hypothetical protein
MGSPHHEERGLAEVLSDLELVQRELAALPADAFAARVDLRDRQHALNAELGRLRQRLGEDEQELRARLAALEAELDAAMASRVSAASQGAGGGPGGTALDPKVLAELNRRIDEGRGTSELADQVRDLRRRLANLAEQRQP